jgi:hypothetical protein
MPDVRIIACPSCDGDRGWESAPYGIDYNDGSLLTSWIKCNECDGTGEVEIEVEPITLNDLIELESE